MSIKDKLDNWDEYTLKPIILTIGKTIQNSGIEGIVNPAFNIVGGGNCSCNRKWC